jgi:alcohol dehydrogenase class IV
VAATGAGTAPFIWHDGERTIRFGRGVAAEAVELLGGPGYTLLTTARASAAAPHVVDAAGAVQIVGPGLVDELAGELRADVRGERLAALGGGRVVDVTKALAAAAGGGMRAMAVPTTLSGAEMTRGHRHAVGVDPTTPRVRPAVVVNDPELSASQPVPELAASALNALGHAAEGPCTPRANPVATLAALEAARGLVAAFGGAGGRAGEPDRDRLALAALLAGYAIDSTGYGLHHVLAQTLVRLAGCSHGAANAVMLPHTLAALAWRFPGQTAALAEAVGEDPSEAAARLCALTGATRLADLGVDAKTLTACAEAAALRPELDATPPRADRAEIRALYEHAW